MMRPTVGEAKSPFIHMHIDDHGMIFLFTGLALGLKSKARALEFTTSE